MRFNRIMRCALAATLAAALTGAGATAAEADTSNEAAAARRLREQILQADLAVFAAVFDTCDIAALTMLVADDFEFYHDKNGVVAKTGRQFVESIRDNNCAHRGDSRSRRELVKDSLEVYPIKDYGAMEIGVHRFYERKGDGPEHLAGTAKFSHVWKNENGHWKLTRVMSYGHEAL